MTNTSEMTGASAQELYLDLLNKCLTRTIAAGTFSVAEPWFTLMRWWFLPVQSFLRARGWTVVRRETAESSVRSEGRDWPADAETMIGLKRLDNLQFCIERVLRDDIPGDFVEAGIWRGVTEYRQQNGIEEPIERIDWTGAYWRRMS